MRGARKAFRNYFKKYKKSSHFWFPHFFSACFWKWNNFLEILGKGWTVKEFWEALSQGQHFGHHIKVFGFAQLLHQPTSPVQLLSLPVPHPQFKKSKKFPTLTPPAILKASIVEEMRGLGFLLCTCHTPFTNEDTSSNSLEVTEQVTCRARFDLCLCLASYHTRHVNIEEPRPPMWI